MPAPNLPIERELREMHQCLARQIPAVARVAAAVYDPALDSLRTFAHSTSGDVPFELYEVPLASVPSLGELVATGRPRVLDDLSVLAGSRSEHSRRLLACGFRSSYTLPFYDAGRFMGFLFLDARETGCFSDQDAWLADFAHLAGLALCHRLGPPLALGAALRAAARLAHAHDPETRSHLDRMSHYALIVGRALAAEEGLTDEYLEYLLLFAPLHDVGKMAVPDAILMKPARLTEREMRVMRTHVLRGSEMVDAILDDLGMQELPHANMLRNVVRHHHEAYDGSGYPDGLAADDIPLEARIVTVADVFDALTSRRSYKPAWTPRDALDYLEDHAGTLFDMECVLALATRVDAAREIAERFRDEDADRQSREGYTRDF